MNIEASGPAARLELSLECDDLPNLDTLSKSDPMVVAYVERSHNDWEEIGRTEVAKDTTNPRFARGFHVDYFFELQQRIRFEVFDVDDDEGGELEKQDFMGEVTIKLGSVVGSRGQQLTRPLADPARPGRKVGTLTVFAEEVQRKKKRGTLQTEIEVGFDLSASKLDNKSLFGKSNPYLTFSRSRDDGTYVVVYRTEIIRRTLNPRWQPFYMPLQRLCMGDYNRPVRVECYSWNRMKEDSYIGGANVTLRQLLNGAVEEVVLKVETKGRRKGREKCGVVKFGRVEEHERVVHTRRKKSPYPVVENQFSFLDYLAGGCEVSLIVAVDFTASNGDPTSHLSLHYNNPRQPNEYIRAIRLVGSILQDYDTDKMYPVYGFGLRTEFADTTQNTAGVSHCFPLNGDMSNPEVKGIEGVVRAYKRALNDYELAGPTYFADILRKAKHIASDHATQENQKYYILLILTDGVINDFQDTIDLIVGCSSLPLSIIIVGVGDEDFEAMERLDADEEALVDSKGRAARRDIVQFVSFRKYGRDTSRAELAADTLNEIPGQLLSYMSMQDIHPNAPLRGDRVPERSPTQSRRASNQVGASDAVPYPDLSHLPGGGGVEVPVVMQDGVPVVLDGAALAAGGVPILTPEQLAAASIASRPALSTVPADEGSGVGGDGDGDDDESMDQ